jgi:hypothetical protein
MDGDNHSFENQNGTSEFNGENSRSTTTLTQTSGNSNTIPPAFVIDDVDSSLNPAPGENTIINTPSEDSESTKPIKNDLERPSSDGIIMRLGCSGLLESTDRKWEFTWASCQTWKVVHLFYTVIPFF